MKIGLASAGQRVVGSSDQIDMGRTFDSGVTKAYSYYPYELSVVSLLEWRYTCMPIE